MAGRKDAKKATIIRKEEEEREVEFNEEGEEEVRRKVVGWDRMG